MGNRKNRVKATKRKKIFCVGNQQFENFPDNLRSRKINKKKLVDESLDKGRNVDSDNYNFIINFSLLKDFLHPFLCCPECNSKNVELIDELSFRMGYARKLNLNCHDCPYSICSFTSPECAQSENIQGRHNDRSEPTNCQVSVDGNWQKRGFSSLNGVVTAMNSGRCIDVHVMSKSCKKCSVWENRKNNPDYDYDQWKAKHFKSDECEINHLKSSSAMDENEYLGDGDSSSYSEVVSSEPYKEHGNIVPQKLECIGHVQKRLGTRLRNMVKKYKGTSTSLSGKEKLTEKTINSMQNYFGRAIRENKNNLYAMKKATGANLWHCTDFQNSDYRHRFCPAGKDSWCKFKENSDYKPSINLDIGIHNLLLPVFVLLSDEELLRKCLHGKTQNSNEALNNIIWTKCPKNVYLGRSVLEIGTNSAVLDFNDGSFGVSSVLKYFGISNGYQLSVKRDKEYIDNSAKKTNEKRKIRRKKIRAAKKGYIDLEKAKESYLSGGF